MSNSKNMNYLYSTLNKNNSVSSMNYNVGDLNFNIDVFLIPKAQDWSKDEITFVKLPQGSKLKSITFNDDIYSISFQGSAIFRCEANDVSNFIEDSHSFHFVMMFSTKANESSEEIKFEPLIFDITEATCLDKSGNTENIQINFEDILISAAKRSTVAELNKEENAITCESYMDLYQTIIRFLQQQIGLEFNNNLFYDAVVYSDDFKESDDKTDDSPTASSQGPLIKLSFDKLKPNSTVYDLLEMLRQDATVEMDYNSSFLETREIQAGSLSKGYVSVPLFFKTEWRDTMGYVSNTLKRTYYSTEDDSTSSTTSEKNTETTETSNKNTNTSETSSKGRSQVELNGIIPRYITLKSIYTPFKMCFHSQTTSSEIGFVYENINTTSLSNEEPKFLSISGNSIKDGSLITIADVVSYDKLPIDAVKSNAVWRNMIFVKENGASTSMSTLIYFSWCKDFFNKVFLNDAGGSSKHYESNVYPSFLSHEKSEDKEGDTAFNRYNSTTKLLRSSDTNVEIMRYLGKTISSMILLNNTYSITLGGNIFRHPNEIIRIASSNISEDSRIKMITDLNSDCALCYVVGVTHYFDCENKKYLNNLVCNKIGNYLPRNTR